MHLLTIPQGRASDVLHGVPKECHVRRILEYLTPVYHAHLKTMTQLIGEPIQEFAIVIEQRAHCALPSLHKDHIHKGASKAFIRGIKE